jgi:hypothetical protein
MSTTSALRHIQTTKKQKPVIKGIVRKDQKKKIFIIINNKVYFVSITALENVLNGTKEKTPIFGY